LRDYILNELLITTNPPRELIQKLAMLAEHDWCSFETIPKVGLLPDKDIEADLLGITLNDDNELLLIFISEYPNGGYIIKQLAKYYKFSFRLNHYSVFTLGQGFFEYDHTVDKETSICTNRWDYSGKVSFDTKTITYTYEDTVFEYKEQLMDYIFNQKVRDEKLDIILGNKAFAHFEHSLPTPRGKRSIIQKIYYKVRVTILKYGYAIKNKIGIYTKLK